jgi:hypothetical protein
MARLGRPPIGAKAMTNAERQKRYRAARDEKLGITRARIRELKRKQGRLSRTARLEREVASARLEAEIQHLSGRLSKAEFRAELERIRQVATRLRP